MAEFIAELNDLFGGFMTAPRAQKTLRGDDIVRAGHVAVAARDQGGALLLRECRGEHAARRPRRTASTCHRRSPRMAGDDDARRRAGARRAPRDASEDDAAERLVQAHVDQVKLAALDASHIRALEGRHGTTVVRVAELRTDVHDLKLLGYLSGSADGRGREQPPRKALPAASRTSSSTSDCPPCPRLAARAPRARADVAEVKTDGATVTLEGVRIPLGPRGLIVLDRATATITSLGDDGPALRLHSFDGVLVFTKPELATRSPHGRRRRVRPERDLSRGHLLHRRRRSRSRRVDLGRRRIERALWTTETPGAPLTRTRRGSSCPRASGASSRLDGAPSTGTDGKPGAVARFAARRLPRAKPTSVSSIPTLDRLLAFSPRVRAHRPFLDAMTALGGEVVRADPCGRSARHAAGRRALPWSATAGARAEMRLDAETIGLAPRCESPSVRAGATSTGASTARSSPRRSCAASTPPRPRSRAGGRHLAGGDDLPAVRAPEAQIETAPQVGFRLGRPRFVPAVVMRDFAGSVFVKEGAPSVASRATRAARSRSMSTPARAIRASRSRRNARRGLPATSPPP